MYKTDQWALASMMHVIPLSPSQPAPGAPVPCAGGQCSEELMLTRDDLKTAEELSTDLELLLQQVRQTPPYPPQPRA